MFLIDTALDPHYEKCENSSRYTDNDTTREYQKSRRQPSSAKWHRTPPQ